jgi:transketolase
VADAVPAHPALALDPSTVPASPDALDRLGIDMVRALALDATRAANSGHAGTAMALAPLAWVLQTRILRHDPADPTWPDRDRFVLSAGHASILAYATLFASGYDLTLDDLKAFRQWGSRTPGHPERGHTAGIEVTTGPLGQGFANAVGMAVAERFLRSRFGAEVMDHRTFVLAGDGCMQEGISHEAASLAGHLGLDRLVAIYDDNHITIDGATELSMSDDTPGRFRAYGWHVVELGEIAEDLAALEAALVAATAPGASGGRPTLLVLRSHIGFPSPAYTDTAFAHGNPFPPEEIATVKGLLGLPADETFWCPEPVLARWRTRVGTRATAATAWRARFAAWSAADAGRRADWDAAWGPGHLDGWAEAIGALDLGAKPVATRAAIRPCINATLPALPGLISGAADLTENTGVDLKGEQAQTAATPGGRQVYFGIREHGMAAAANGMALHGGILPVVATFFVFSDYLRPALRLAALSRAKVVHVLTHDSVGLGEDGPTHQPVEHLASLRAIPDLSVIRPADAIETAGAWRCAVEHDGPTALVLSRQALPVLAGTRIDGVERGGYVVVEAEDGDPDVVLIGTGSEVAVCVEAAATLAAEGVRTRVVSLPSWDRFAAQDEDYRASVLPVGVPRVACEAGTSFGWERHADVCVGIDRFGASAPGAEALRRLGITAEAVAAAARRLV